MHICFVARECSPYTGGGIGTYIRNVAIAMRWAGHEVTLVSDLLDSGLEEEARADFAKEGINFVFPRKVSITGYHHFYHEYADRVYHTLCDLHQEKPFDVIEFPEYRGEGFTTIRAKRLLGEFLDVKLAVKCHTPTSILQEINNTAITKDTYYAIYMEDYSVRYADVVLSPSSSLAEYYRKRLRVRVNISPYPLEISNNRQKKKLGLGGKIVYIGRIEWRKGVDLLIRSVSLLMEKHKNFELFLYGGDTFSAPFGGSMIEYLKRRCIPPEISDRIHFMGNISREEIPEVISSADVCVFPSRWENWPNACLEAMLLGVPVVVSKHGGMSEIVEDGVSGFVVDPMDSQAMARCIEAVLLDEVLSRSFSEQAVLRAHYLCDYHRVVPLIIQGYQDTALQNHEIENVKQEPLVSVIVPIYNQTMWLHETIESVLSSSYSNLEIVIVDDGSIDNSAVQVINSIEHPKVRKVRQNNRGLAGARNSGIREAKGHFILPLDADDRIDPNYIRDAVQALVNNPKLSFVTCYVQYFGDYSHQWIPIGLVESVILIENAASVCSAVFRADVIKQLGCYDESMPAFEDWDLLCRLAEGGYEGDVLPRVYFYYRRHQDSMMNRDVSRMRFQLNQYMIRKNAKLSSRYAKELLCLSMYKSSDNSNPASPCNIKDYEKHRRLLESKTFQILRYYHYFMLTLRSMFRDGFKVYFITIEVVGDKNQHSMGCEVWFFGLYEERYGVYVTKPFMKRGEWKSLDFGNEVFKRCLFSSQKGARLSRMTSRGETRLVFLNHHYSGLVRINLGDFTDVIDLYSPERDASIAEYIWDGRSLSRRRISLLGNSA